MHLRLLIGSFLLLTTTCFSQEELHAGVKASAIQFKTAFPANYHIPENKPIVLDFWATWCAPCVAGLIENNRLVAKYGDRIEFVAIADVTSKKVAEFIRSRDFKHHFIIDKDTQTFAAFGVSGIPHAFIIDTKGIIQWSGYGRDIDEAMLNEFLQNGTVAERKDTTQLFAYNDSSTAGRVMNLVITDTALLQKHRTILKAKVENSLGQFSNSPKREGRLTVINYTLKELAERINPFFSNLKLQVGEEHSAGYDFIGLPFDNFEVLNQHLKRYYGVYFK